MARESNISLPGNHTWDHLHNQDKFWVQLLFVKYLQGCNILNVQPSNGASYIWNSIMKSIAVLKPGFRTRIWKRHLSIWYDRWLEEDVIFHLFPFVNIQDVHLRVSDIHYDGQWHFEHIATLLPLDVKMKLQSHFVNDATDDMVN